MLLSLWLLWLLFVANVVFVVIVIAFVVIYAPAVAIIIVVIVCFVVEIVEGYRLITLNRSVIFLSGTTPTTAPNTTTSTNETRPPQGKG